MAKEATRNGLIAATFVVSMAVFMTGLYWLKSFFTLTSNQEVHRKVLAPPNPALQNLRVEEARVLGGYGWVDREKGIVHIPVERAMDLLVEEARRNLPAGGGSE
jgi:hypothetical protein